MLFGASFGEAVHHSLEANIVGVGNRKTSMYYNGIGKVPNSGLYIMYLGVTWTLVTISLSTIQ